MKLYLPLTGAIAGIVASFAASAQAQPVCGARNDIVGKLNTTYEERQSAIGLASNGTLLEVFSSKSGSWTIMYTQPGGVTCLMATGRNWLDIKEAATPAQKKM